MKVVAAVLSYNRRALWKRTVKSLDRSTLPLELVFYDNGSSDGTEALVDQRGGVCNKTDNHTIGHGVRAAMALALKRRPDLVLLTGDDYEYHDRWLERLLAFWAVASPKVAICTLSIEPAYHWSPVIRTKVIGGQVVLVRRTVPGANWSFRPELWREIGPMVPENSHKYDHRICAHLNAQGRWLCALPLAEHIGEGRRSWQRG